MPAELRRFSPRERGQASIELLAGLPLLLAAALAAAQLLLVGYALSLADGSAEAGAIAAAGGEDPAEAARAALPGWARDRSEIAVSGGRVRVEVRPPAPAPALAELLEVGSEAWARPPADEDPGSGGT
jgi:hypothetical protein